MRPQRRTCWPWQVGSSADSRCAMSLLAGDHSSRKADPDATLSLPSRPPSLNPPTPHPHPPRTTTRRPPGVAGFLVGLDGTVAPGMASSGELATFRSWLSQCLLTLRFVRRHYERSDPQVRPPPPLSGSSCPAAPGRGRAPPTGGRPPPTGALPPAHSPQVICGFGMTRERAEAALATHPPGTFLLRFGRSPGALVLSGAHGPRPTTLAPLPLPPPPPLLPPSSFRTLRSPTPTAARDQRGGVLNCELSRRELQASHLVGVASSHHTAGSCTIAHLPAVGPHRIHALPPAAASQLVCCCHVCCCLWSAC